MPEKIKITLSKDVYDILIKDCELFEFYKKDRELNKNLFLTTLILNYYEEFSSSQRELTKNLKQVLTSYRTTDVAFAAEEILKLIHKKTEDTDKKETVTVNLKPTKASEATLEYIEAVLIVNQSISSFYRQLLYAYTRLPRDKRELIIFKPVYTKLVESIRQDAMVFFTTNRSEKGKRASVYSVESSKEELFNYVLLDIDGLPATYRLSRIKSVKLLKSPRTDFTKLLPLFQRMCTYGPQYLITPKDAKPIKIKMTPQGEAAYEKIYLYRPKYSEKDGNIYTFECSYIQIIHYFSRFGKDAVLLEPAELKIKLKYFYKNGYESYKEIKKDRIP